MLLVLWLEEREVRRQEKRRNKYLAKLVQANECIRGKEKSVVNLNEYYCRRK
jgi:hypothetical protein